MGQWLDPPFATFVLVVGVDLRPYALVGVVVILLAFLTRPVLLLALPVLLLDPH